MDRAIIPGVVREQEIIALTQTSTIHDAVQAMSTHNIAAIAVINNDGKLVGIVSERDMTHRVLACGLNPQATHLADVMTENPEALHPNDKCVDAIELMLERNFRHLPVITDDEKVIAMVSMRDLLVAALEDLNVETDAARDEAFAPQ